MEEVILAEFLVWGNVKEILRKLDLDTITFMTNFP